MQLSEYEQRAIHKLGESIHQGKWSNQGMVQFKKDDRGRESYQQCVFLDKTANCKPVFGQVGTLAELSTMFMGSVRQQKRHAETNNKIHTNRASHKGRGIYYQLLLTKDGKSKTIKHFQETTAAIKRKTAFIETLNRIEVNKGKWHKKHPECCKKNNL